MATVTPTITRNQGAATITWSAMATGDTINAIDLWAHGLTAGLATLQFTGTFAGGTTVTLTGSNAGTTYALINDTLGTSTSQTAAGTSEISTAFRYLKPTIASGTGDAVTATVSVIRV